ncbi:MAG: glycosyltransferase family 4 protein [Moraxellaceae bacterium]|nr:glycosyltransferase family 4 protein [Moraxellaceae bacterium]
MRCIVYLEERFLRDKEGNYYSVVFGDEYWARYLSVYSSLLVVARSVDISSGELTEHHQAIKDDRVSFATLPYYKGPQQFLIVFLSLLNAIRKCARIDGVHILRVPGVIASMALPFLIFSRRPFGVELVGDPYQVFESGGVGGFFSSFYKKVFTFLTRKACGRASAVAYVTRYAMQAAYPAADDAFTTHYSSIQLQSEMIVDSRAIECDISGRPFTIFMVGSMEQRYKGFDVMIRALQILSQSKSNVIVKIAGSGACQAELELLANQLGISQSVVFLGLISRASVLSTMDDVDLFVMPSRTEGLPRALIEAMARGLPALGSNVGGIPELLDSEFIFENGNYAQLAGMIDALIGNISLLSMMSSKNIVTARSYEIGELRVRQKKFYEYLYNVSASS